MKKFLAQSVILSSLVSYSSGFAKPASVDYSQDFDRHQYVADLVHQDLADRIVDFDELKSLVKPMRIDGERYRIGSDHDETLVNNQIGFLEACIRHSIDPLKVDFAKHTEVWQTINHDPSIIDMHVARPFAEKIVQYLIDHDDALHIVTARDIKSAAIDTDLVKRLLMDSFSDIFSDHSPYLDLGTQVTIHLSDPISEEKTKFHTYSDIEAEHHRYLMIFGDSKSDFYGFTKHESVYLYGIIPVFTPRPGDSTNASAQSIDQVLILLEALDDAFPEISKQINERCNANSGQRKKQLWANFLKKHQKFE